MQRIQKQQGVTLFLLLVFLVMGGATGSMAQVTFKASAPATVVQGEQFRLSFVLNKEGRDLRLPDMPDFDLLLDLAPLPAIASVQLTEKQLPRAR